MVTFKEPDSAIDLSSHTLVNHTDLESDQFALATIPGSEMDFEVKVISVRENKISQIHMLFMYISVSPTDFFSCQSFLT